MCKRPQPRLRIDALTGEWRKGEAGEGRGSQPCEPGGLRHQAGGASWRAPNKDPVGKISPGPTRWPPGAERRLVPAKSNLKSQTSQDQVAASLCPFAQRFKKMEAQLGSHEEQLTTMNRGAREKIATKHHVASTHPPPCPTNHHNGIPIEIP